jgi:hypothetical protein
MLPRIQFKMFCRLISVLYLKSLKSPSPQGNNTDSEFLKFAFYIFIYVYVFIVIQAIYVSIYFCRIH